MRISDWSSDVCSSDLTGTATLTRAAPDDFVGTFNTDRFCNSVCKSGYLRHDGNDDGVPAFSIVNPTGSRTARSEEHTSELQSLMRISYAVFCLKKKKHDNKDQ